jgi:hypothetical protein
MNGGWLRKKFERNGRYILKGTILVFAFTDSKEVPKKVKVDNPASSMQM